MSEANNPLLKTEGLPLFSQIKPDHVEPATKHMLEQVRKEFKAIESSKSESWDDLVPPLEALSRRLDYTWGPVSHLYAVRNAPALREAYEKMQPEVVQLGLELGQNKNIYDRFKKLQTQQDNLKLTEAQRRIVRANVLSAELSGVALPEDKRKRFNEIEQRLSQLSTTFSNNVLDSIKSYELIITDPKSMDGTPESYKAFTAQSYNQSKPERAGKATTESGPWRITMDHPGYYPFLQHSKDRATREKLYRAQIIRASEPPYDNQPLIEEILKLRAEKAKILGFKTFAELSLARKMAPSVQAVDQLSDTIRAAAWPKAQQELKDLQKFANAKGHPGELAHWDIAFWSERMREELYGYKDEDLRAYFPLTRVLDGLFGLVNRIFGIKVVAADGEADIWHQDVRFFKIFDQANKHIASFFLDPYSRPAEKRGGAWMNDCRGRCVINGKTQIPVAYLVCNSTPPVGNKPALLGWREVETLFHEFGHGLQHMLTKVDYLDVSGINGVEWDAVELPSQFMENWCYHKPTVDSMSAHYETGEPLPNDLFQKLVAAKNYMSALGNMRQLQFGMVDIELHHRFDFGGKKSLWDVARELFEKMSVMKPLPENRFLCAFSHIFAGGYAAGYYSYKWAEVLSADAFGAFEEAGLDNEKAVRAVGERYRDTVLSLGGSKHPMDVFKAFRGREPSADALLRHTGLKA